MNKEKNWSNRRQFNLLYLEIKEESIQQPARLSDSSKLGSYQNFCADGLAYAWLQHDRR